MRSNFLGKLPNAPTRQPFAVAACTFARHFHKSERTTIFSHRRTNNSSHRQQALHRPNSIRISKQHAERCRSSFARRIHSPDDEFPLVRLGIIRYLNENMGFHILAMEGSAEDIWVAQDRFLNSPHTSADAEDSQQGLFGLWNTPEVRQLFEYEAASWSSANPFYVTAYDIQPGSGNNSHGTEVFHMLSERLNGYAPAPQGLDVAQWINDLGTITHGCNDYQTSDQPRVENAIQNLQKWIDAAAPEVQKRFPNAPHSIALSLIPENLRASLQLCKDFAADNRNNYKAHRDTNAAPYALELKAAVPSRI